MSQAKLEAKLVRRSRRSGAVPTDPFEAAKMELEHLLEQGHNQADIARLLKASGADVRGFMDRCGIDAKRTPTLEEAVHEHGYESVDAFFLKNATKTYAQMADMVGVTGQTVSRHYKAYIKNQKESLSRGALARELP